MKIGNKWQSTYTIPFVLHLKVKQAGIKLNPFLEKALKDELFDKTHLSKAEILEENRELRKQIINKNWQKKKEMNDFPPKKPSAWNLFKGL